MEGNEASQSSNCHQVDGRLRGPWERTVVSYLTQDPGAALRPCVLLPPISARGSGEGQWCLGLKNSCPSFPPEKGTAGSAGIRIQIIQES